MDSQQLPLCSDVLLDYLYEKNEHPSSSATFAMLKDRTLARLISVYDMVPQPIISAARIEEKLKQLLKEYALVKKNSPTSPKAEKSKLSLANLFDISKCKCPMEPVFGKGKMVCKCDPNDRIHQSEYEFIKDQRSSARKMVISAQVDHFLSDRFEDMVVRKQLWDLSSTQDQLAPHLAPSSPQLIATRTWGKQYDFAGQELELEDMSDRSFAPPPFPMKKLCLLDKKQCHISDRNWASNRLMSNVLSHSAETVNVATEDINMV